MVPIPITVPLAGGNLDARDDVAAEGQAAGVGIHGVELRVVRSRAAERGRCAARRGGELRVRVLGTEDADFIVRSKVTFLVSPFSVARVSPPSLYPAVKVICRGAFFAS